MAPRVMGTSLPATATALCTEAATAWRAAGRGAAQRGRQPPLCPRLEANRVNRQTLPQGGVRHSPLAREVRGASVLSGFFMVLAFARGPVGV